MSGVARKLLGGVLAISLIIFSALPAFAFDFRFNNLYYSDSSGWHQFASLGTNNSGYYTGLLSDITSLMMLIGSYSSSESGYYTSSFHFLSTDSFDSVNARVDYYSSSDSTYRYSVDILDFGLVNGVNNNHTVYVTFGQLIGPVEDYNIEISFTFYNKGVQVYPDVSEITTNFSVYTSSSPMPTSPPVYGDSSITSDQILGTVNQSSGHVSLVVSWERLILQLSSYFHDVLGPFFINLFSFVQDNFVSLTGNIGSYFSALFNRMDQQEDDYQAVTDPSTSQDIQEAQGMIDTVEGFESQLHANITTEFDKIDFTTPTNLAAPVAYIGDKVTRSMNSLGNYQPLIFVPLTLGIMLIMLGRGVSALGSLVSSSSRAVARIRSKGDGS